MGTSGPLYSPPHPLLIREWFRTPKAGDAGGIVTMLLDEARSALDTGPVCNHCLGRCFRDRGTDLSNEDRGHALRVSVALADDEPITPVEPADCWVCEGLVPDYDVWADRVEEALSELAFETFLLGTHVPDEIEANETDIREQAGLDATAGEPLRAECNREVGKRLEARLPAIVDHDYPDVVAIQDLDDADVDLQLNPAYLFGRYRKLEPGLAQRIRVCRVCNGRGTEWREGEAQPCEHCGGSGYDTKESIEWYVTEAIQATMDGSDTVFNAAGREDQDVLVRGEGRPFVVEIKKPRTRPADLSAIKDDVRATSDGAIEVEGLSPASRDLVAHLTQTTIAETYRLELTFGTRVDQASFEAALDSLDSASVRQRIEHDGRVSEQIRSVDGLRGELQSETTATVEIYSTDGLDLEALMVGDADRSDPNLASLLETAVTVDSIAVIDVEGEEEPIEDTALIEGSSE